MSIKTSELISKIVLASEASCQCEDENFQRIVNEVITSKSEKDFVSLADLLKIIRATTDFSRFISIRTTCKVLQDLGIAENDVDVFDNDAFRSELSKAFHVK